ncbi:MAG: helix-turn-helix transcriptional regulator [Candidatus Acidiferrales bacterium]
MQPGSSLRQVRERLGLTYRDVEQSSYELASKHGRPEFIIHISRLADIENAGVTPTLHKLYTLCTLYHLDVFEVCQWYDIPLEEHFRDGFAHGAKNTHLATPPRRLSLPLRFDPTFDPRRSDSLTRMVESWKQFEGALLDGTKHRYGFVGTEDRWMDPLVRPGSLLLIDPMLQEIDAGGWQNEFERPLYFVDIRQGYRCSWCSQDRGRLILQPYPHSSSAPECYRYPEDAEIVGRVVGVAMRLTQR